MLTADLVRARIYRGEVRPRYVDADDGELLELARQLIDTFAEHEGRPRGELSEELKELVGTGTDFLLHRGLAKLLTDRCDFETASEVEPEEVRRAVFTAAAAAHRRGEAGAEGQARHFDRSAVMAEVAAALAIEPAEVERGLYADLKDEQLLDRWKPCRPRWLLDRYNVALAQGVLLRATELTIRIREPEVRRQRALLRKIKFFQLLHRIEELPDGGYLIRLDGPMSLFQASGKYGVQMASFLPTLLHFDHWSLEASVRWGKRRQERSFQLAAADGLRPYTRLTGQWQPEELSWLPERFGELDSPWTISTDAEIVPLGGQGVLVPDFVFEHRERGTRVFMEVLGFWRKGALESRLELLRRHGPKNVVLAVSKQLATGRDDLDDLPGGVYLFRAAPIARKVLKLLEERFG